MKSRIDDRKELSEELSEDQLNKLPNEIFQIELHSWLSMGHSAKNICGYISPVFQTSKRLHAFFPDERQLGLDLLHRLLSHGALGELEEAENVWKFFPDLLTCRGTIYHPNRCYLDAEGNPLTQAIDIPLDQNPGRPGYVDRTYWQILLMNEEYEEAEAVSRYMSDEEKKKQFAEIFPDGKMVKYSWDLAYAKGLLQAVFDAIINDTEINYYRDNSGDYKLEKMAEATRKVLNAMYQYANSNPKHKTGLVCDVNFYIAALEYYDKDITFDQFKNVEQRIFWCRQVEEWLAGGLGTGYLSAHTQGIANQVMRKGCMLDDGTPYFAFRRSSNALPGVDFFVGYYGSCGSGSVARHARSLLKYLNLRARKNESRDRLYAVMCSESIVTSSLRF